MATIVLIKEAITALKDRSGSSVIAINKYLESEKKVRIIQLEKFVIVEAPVFFNAFFSLTLEISKMSTRFLDQYLSSESLRWLYLFLNIMACFRSVV